MVREHRDADPAFWGLEGTIVAWLPRNTPAHRYGTHVRLPQPGNFFIHFDDPPLDMYGNTTNHKIHHGGPWCDALVEPAPPEPTIGEIADLFGIDPYEVAKAALEEADEL